MMNPSDILKACVFLSTIITASSTFRDESVLLREKKELHRLNKHLEYLGSVHANPKERADLIRKGIAKIEDLKHQEDSKVLRYTTKFDCKLRKLAFDFAKKLQPGRNDAEGMQAVFDALELAPLCNLTSHTLGIRFKRRASNNDVRKDGVVIFVDQANGNENHDGTILKPLLDIQSGINLCKRKRSCNTIACNVFVRSGTYHIKEAIIVKDDNIHISAYQNEDVIITSDVSVEPKWKLFQSKMETYLGLNPIFEGIKPNQTTKRVIFAGVMKDAQDCEKACSGLAKCNAFAFFDATTKEFTNHCYMRVDGRWNTISTSGVLSGKKIVIYSADLSAYQLQKVNSIFVNGRRAIRARYPNGNPETMGLHTNPTGYVNADRWLPPRDLGDALELHIQSPQRPATIFPGFQIGIGGPVYQFDPPQSYWGTQHPVGGAASRYKVPSGLQYSKDSEINSRYWKNPSTGLVHALQHYHWANWIFKLDGRNETSKTLHWTEGGFQESRGSDAGNEWYVENIFEELDSANEWFYDDQAKVLYYFPNLTETGLPNKLSIPQLPSLFQIIGTKARPVRNTLVQGVTFKHAIKTFMEPYIVPSGGDWTVHKNAALYIEGSENTLVDQCTFDSPEGNGILIINYNRGAVLSHNVMYRLGDNAIVLLGDTDLIDGTQGDQPRGTKVLSNLIYENGLWGKQTCSVVQSLSCETLIEGNVFFNGPRAGINFNDGFGGGNIINNNLLFNFVRETSDHGPINSWDRVPYLTKLYDGQNVSLKVKENQIHHNFVINYYHSEWPLDHDDGSSFWNDTHNVLAYGGFKNFMGYNKSSTQSIYIYPNEFCMDTRAQGYGTSGYGDVYSNNTCIIGTSNLYRLGNCNQGQIQELIPLLKNNKYYTPKGEFVARCGSNAWTLKQFQAIGMDIGTVVQDLVDDDIIIQWAKDLLTI